MSGRRLRGKRRNFWQHFSLSQCHSAYPDELEEDVVLPFPPVQRYSVDLTVTKITKWKLKLVVTEDLL